MTDVPISAGFAPAASALAARRLLFAALTVATMAGLLGLALASLSPHGIDGFDIALLTLFAVTLPWTVIGFWNAIIGLIILRTQRDPAAAVFPAAGAVGQTRITAATAILLCIRNEAPEQVIRNLGPMLSGLEAEGVADRFHLYVLSDTTDAALAAAEEARFGALAEAWRDRFAVTYRRRRDNTGFKAGNIGDFCERWGSAHDFAVMLDADSVMPAAAILRLVRIMQADPSLGIVQALVIGLPSTSAFARIFQFGMRLGMRSYTLGSAWWQGDCGPYWGHNAILRLQPFSAYCRLPSLPGEQHILSHDQIEAVLMRRAGYAVRVLVEEDLGWEANPPTLLEFLRRDLRWCQGNMQYWRFLRMPGLLPVSRYQLLFAILMFIGSPAWIGLLVVGTLALTLKSSPADFIDPRLGTALLVVVVVMWFAPQFASTIDILLWRQQRREFGGTLRFLAGLVTELVFSLLLNPIMWLGHTLYLCRLPFARRARWTGQTRDDHSVGVRQAVRALWPQTLLGIAVVGALALTHPAAIPYALLLAGGLVLAIPLAVFTALPKVGGALVRIGLCRLPEETAPPPTLRALAPAAVETAAASPSPPL